MSDQNGLADPVGQPQYDWQRKDYRSFEFGDVIGRAFSLLRQHFIPFVLTALLIVGVPTLIAILILMLAMGVNEASSVAAAPLWIGFVISVVGTIVGAILLPAAIIFAALRGWTGEPVSMRQSVKVMLGRFWSLLGLGILSGLAIAIGFILLIIPGLILYAGWFVVVAVLVMEKTSPTEAMSRSWELTSGYKWQTFGIFVITAIIGMVIGVIASIPGIALGVQSSFEFQSGVSTTVGFGVGSIIAQVFSTFGEIIAQLITALIIASTYFELRRVKEGVAMNSIADIFS